MVKMDENGDVPKDELITFYHQEFVRALTTFGYSKPLPSLLDLNIELLKHGKLNVLLTICFMPFSFVDWQTTKVEELFAVNTEKSRNIRKQLFEHPICKKIIQNELKSWWNKGWLDN
jgi:hypothetical protein